MASLVASPSTTPRTCRWLPIGGHLHWARRRLCHNSRHNDVVAERIFLPKRDHTLGLLRVFCVPSLSQGLACVKKNLCVVALCVGCRTKPVTAPTAKKRNTDNTGTRNISGLYTKYIFLTRSRRPATRLSPCTCRTVLIETCVFCLLRDTRPIPGRSYLCVLS